MRSNVVDADTPKKNGHKSRAATPKAASQGDDAAPAPRAPFKSIFGSRPVTPSSNSSSPALIFSSTPKPQAGPSGGLFASKPVTPIPNLFSSTSSFGSTATQNSPFGGFGNGNTGFGSGSGGFSRDSSASRLSSDSTKKSGSDGPSQTV